MSYQVTIEPLGYTIDVAEGQTILDAALRAGVYLPHACGHGLCATCKVQVTDGEVEHNDASPFALMDTEREDGKTLATGDLKLPELAPLSESTVAVPVAQVKPKAGAEYFVRLSCKLDHDTLWAKRGFEIATAQFALPLKADPAPAAKAAAMKPVKLDEATLTVSGEGFQVVFDKTTGTISRLEKGGVNILAPAGGPQLHLWRTPHRNDDMWAYGEWSRCGLDNLTRTRTQPSAAFTSSSRFMWRETSTTMPSVSDCPFVPVPPPRGAKETPAKRGSAETRAMRCRSSASRG